MEKQAYFRLKQTSLIYGGNVIKAVTLIFQKQIDGGFNMNNSAGASGKRTERSLGDLPRPNT